MNTHPEQWAAILLRRPGSSWGSVPCSRVSPQSWYWGWKRALVIPSPHLQSLPDLRLVLMRYVLFSLNLTVCVKVTFLTSKQLKVFHHFCSCLIYRGAELLKPLWITAATAGPFPVCAGSQGRTVCQDSTCFLSLVDMAAAPARRKMQRRWKSRLMM